MNDRKIEVMYFYSDDYENERNLSKLTRRMNKKKKDLQVHLVNINEPRNEELTQLYGVTSVPVLIFLTPTGKIAARRYVSLSEEDIVDDVTNRIHNGEIPNPRVEDFKERILDSIRSVTKRNDISEIIAEQVENDLAEVSAESEVYELVNSHISIINHTSRDLQELKRVLQKYQKRPDAFVV